MILLGSRWALLLRIHAKEEKKERKIILILQNES